MDLFVTAGKVKQVLEINGPQGCVKEFGPRARKALYQLILSDKENFDLRKRAIEALILAGIIDDTVRRDRPDLGLSGMTSDLKNVFFNLALSEKADAKTKRVILALIDHGDKELREEIYQRVMSSDDPELADLIAEGLQEEGLSKYLRALLVGLLVAKRGLNALPTLQATLQKCNAHYNGIIVDRIVEAMIKLKASGAGLEEILIKKLQELEINGMSGNFGRAVEQITCFDEYGWRPDPCKQIVDALALIGGKKALSAMLEVFATAAESDKLTLLDSSTNPNDQAMGQLAKNQHTVDFLTLVQGMLSLFQKLKESGEISNPRDVEGLEEFLNKQPLYNRQGALGL